MMWNMSMTSHALIHEDFLHLIRRDFGSSLHKHYVLLDDKSCHQLKRLPSTDAY